MPPIISLTQLKATTPQFVQFSRERVFLADTSWRVLHSGTAKFAQMQGSHSGNIFLQYFQLLSAVDVWSWAGLNSTIPLLHVIFHFIDHYYHYYYNIFFLQAEVIVYSISLCTETILHLPHCFCAFPCLSHHHLIISWHKMKVQYWQWNLALFK